MLLRRFSDNTSIKQPRKNMNLVSFLGFEKGFFMFKFTTKKLVRAGIIAALYAGVTYIFAPYAYGPFQIRPAEALTILPIFFTEAVPGLFIGCALANILSGYGVYDIVFGSLITLAAAILTYFVGKVMKRSLPSALVGGIFPVFFNAIGIPIIIILVSGDNFAVYWIYFFQMLLTQSVWIYALGIPLFLGVRRLNKTVSFFKTDE